jgi:hypothetical protein
MMMMMVVVVVMMGAVLTVLEVTYWLTLVTRNCCGRMSKG